MKTVDQLQQDLALLDTCNQEDQMARPLLEARLVAMLTRLAAYAHKRKWLLEELEEAVRLEEDQKKPTYRVVSRSDGQILDIMVVRKVTDKRIYMAHVGSAAFLIFGHDGLRVSKLGVERIHPEDLVQITSGKDF